jgi:hypothetical protein
MHTDHPRRRRAWLPALTACVVAAGLAAGCGSSSDDSTETASAGSGSSGTIKVGVLHSLSGTMAISEVSVKDSELLAIKEINAAGGVLGKKVEPVIEDGASDWPTFAEKAQKLISQDKVAATFGGWTSASRKAMLPVFERNKALLYYPVHLLLGRDDQPADHPRAGVPEEGEGHQEALPGGQRLRLPAHGQQGDQGLGQGQRDGGHGRGVRPARIDGVLDDRQQGEGVGL